MSGANPWLASIADDARKAERQQCAEELMLMALRASQMPIGTTIDGIAHYDVAHVLNSASDQIRKGTPREPANQIANSDAPSPEVVRDQSVKPEQT